MQADLTREFLEHSVKKLEQYTDRIENCLSRLNEEQIWARGSDNQNAVGNLALHLAGNVRQWIIASVGSQPDVRQRDLEFSTRGGVAVPELIERLRATVREAAGVIRSVTPERLGERITVQKYDVSVMEAIFHVVEHFSMHTGQIMFATKMLTGEDLGFYRHLSSAAAHGQKTP